MASSLPPDHLDQQKIQLRPSAHLLFGRNTCPFSKKFHIPQAEPRQTAQNSGLQLGNHTLLEEWIGFHRESSWNHGFLPPNIAVSCQDRRPCPFYRNGFRITTVIRRWSLRRARAWKTSGLKILRPKIQWCNTCIILPSNLEFWAIPYVLDKPKCLLVLYQSLVRQVAHTVSPFQCLSGITCKP